MDRHTPEQRRRNMQAIKSSNTKIELLFGKALWANGYRYRKNDKRVIGKPDFTLKRYSIAIFCDSEFWHGKNWETLKKKLDTNKEYWISKIERNIERDKKVNTELINQQWTVIRFWECDLKNNIADCISLVQKQIEINKPPKTCRR